MILNYITDLIQITESGAWNQLSHTLMNTAGSAGKALWREGKQSLSNIGSRVADSTAYHRSQLAGIDKSKLKDEAISFAKSDTGKKIGLGIAGTGAAIGIGKYALGHKTAISGAKLAEKGLNKVAGVD